MKYDVCVIMPCYNAAGIVERAFRSVLEQRNVSVQLIAVNDGSSDATGQVLRKLANESPANIDVIILEHERNRGLAGARLTAFEAADARYVTQCDADDLLLPGALSTMYKAGIEADADVVVGVMKVDDGRGHFTIGKADTPFILNEVTINTFNFSNHTKLFRLATLRAYNIRPVESIDRWDDLVLLAKLMARDPKVVMVDDVVYEYLYDHSQPSLSRSQRDQLLRDHIAGAIDVEAYFKAAGVAERFAPFLNYLKFCAKVKYLRGKGKDVARWKSTFPEANRHIIKYKRIPLFLRLGFIGVNALPTALSQAIFNVTDRLFYH